MQLIVPTHILMLIICHLLNTISSCIVKQDDKEGTWDQKQYKRRYKSCTCGTDHIMSQLHNKPWGVFIRIETPEDPTANIMCVGTIIASNLVATSHKCFTSHHKRLNLYDVWNPKFRVKNAANLEDRVTVSTKYFLFHPDERTFPVEKIIYHPRYLEGISNNKFPTNDILLLKLKKKINFENTPCDEFGNCPLQPICIPTSKEASYLLYQTGYYYGMGGDDEDPTRQPLGSGETMILPGSICDIEMNGGIISGEDAVCVKFRIHPPTVEGGPLIVNAKNSQRTAYLAGLSSWVGKNQFPPVGIKYAYFSHIKFLVNYIEQQANIHKSEFCKPPKDARVPEKVSLPVEDEVREWESGEHFGRDESLDCVCGQINSKLPAGPTGRIKGGVEATPREFGWMLFTSWVIDDSNFWDCGASVINDRMLLTAAHCVINKETSQPYHPDMVYVYARVHNATAALNGLDKLVQELRVVEVIAHPDFAVTEKSGGYLDYDIALLVLKEPLKFPTKAGQTKDSIVPICLPLANQPIRYVLMNATVAGWGVKGYDPINKRDKYADNLLKITVPIQPPGFCRDFQPQPVTSSMICGSIDPEKDSGKGDSGGPLMVSLLINPTLDKAVPSNWHSVQLGIVSIGWPVKAFQFYDASMVGGDPRYQAGVSAIYANVQSFLPFIEYHAKKKGAKWCKFEK